MTNKPSPAQSDIDHQQPCARLVQFTDLHWVTDEHVEQRGMNTRDSFERVTAAAQPMVERADAVLLTGDIAHDELPTTYQALKPNLLALNTPVWALPGNHDLPDAMAREFSEAPFGYLSHYELDNWLVVLLDSHWSGTAKGRLGKTEVQRLAQTVADSTAEHVLVALHHHPLALQSAWLDQVALEDADDLLRVLTADSRHRAVVYGHVHQAHDRIAHNIRWLACPSTNSQFAPRSNDFAMDSRPPGFRWLNLYANGDVLTDIAWLQN